MSEAEVCTGAATFRAAVFNQHEYVCVYRSSVDLHSMISVSMRKEREHTPRKRDELNTPPHVLWVHEAV